jgi:hypothetical protein
MHKYIIRGPFTKYFLFLSSPGLSLPEPNSPTFFVLHSLPFCTITSNMSFFPSPFPKDLHFQQVSPPGRPSTICTNDTLSETQFAHERTLGGDWIKPE